MLSSAPTTTYSVAVVGARGYVGQQLVRLLDDHPALTTTVAVSRLYAGKHVQSEYHAGPADLRFTHSLEEHLADCPDILILGLPDGHARDAVSALDLAGARPTLIIDLSADHRFDSDWAYAVPELHADRLVGADRIANPGCYATAMQLSLAPISDLLSSTPHCFGVSGYTGAGSTPSEKNNIERLRAGVLPYALTGHTHEREVTRHLGRDVRFAPSVAGYPRGITLTALLDFVEPTSHRELTQIFATRYDESPFVCCLPESVPCVQGTIETPRAIVGGFAVDRVNPHRAAVVCVLDNLLKGAASQAIQNINIALGFPSTAGLLP